MNPFGVYFYLSITQTNDLILSPKFIFVFQFNMFLSSLSRHRYTHIALWIVMIKYEFDALTMTELMRIKDIYYTLTYKYIYMVYANMKKNMTRVFIYPSTTNHQITRTTTYASFGIEIKTLTNEQQNKLSNEFEFDSLYSYPINGGINNEEMNRRVPLPES